MPHEHAKGAGKEHPKTHVIIITSIILFVPVWILDSFVFPLSTQLFLFIPLYIRLIFFAIFLAIALVFQYLSNKAVFGEGEVKPLRKTGIFAHVRNPMYLSTPLIFISLVLSSMSLISIIPVIITFLLYTNMVKFEEKDLEKVFGQEYVDYKDKVPRWLPRVTPAKF